MELHEVLKSGAILAEDVAFSGELTPKQGTAFISGIVDNSDFFKRITVDVTGKLTKVRKTYDVAKGILRRHVPGKGATDAQLKKLGVIGCKLNMTNGVVLDAQITDEALEDNQGNTSFEKEQFDGFSKGFGNDLNYLGMVGIADNEADNAPFNELAKGWPIVASESVDTKKATYVVVTDDAGQTVVNALDKVVKTSHPDVKTEIAIIISPDDYSDYEDYISEKHQNSTVLLNGAPLRYKGRELVIHPHMPQGTYLGTPLKNMVLGMSRKIRKDRWWDNATSSILFKYVSRPDYEFDIKKYVTLVTAAP